MEVDFISIKAASIKYMEVAATSTETVETSMEVTMEVICAFMEAT